MFMTAQHHEPPVPSRPAETPAAIRAAIEALEWQRNPAGQRAFTARMERHFAEGPPGPARRITRKEFRAQLGVRVLFRWELEDLARDQLAGMPPGPQQGQPRRTAPADPQGQPSPA